LDLTSFKSLNPCSKSQVSQSMEGAAKKIEVYVDGIEPQLFNRLKLPSWIPIHLTISAKSQELNGEGFVAFCQKVLYESMNICVDEKVQRLVSFGRRTCRVAIALCTLVLIFFPMSVLLKSGLYFLISLVSWVMYQLYQYQVKVEVSEIKRKTQFKILDDLELSNLPALYIIDDEKIFMGKNIWDSENKEAFFEVSSFEEGVALKLIYREYANSQPVVEEEDILAKYLQATGLGSY